MRRPRRDNKRTPNLRASCCLLSVSPLWMYKPCYSDAEKEKNDHGSGEDAHVKDVSRGSENRRKEEDDEDSVTSVAPEKACVHDAEEREEKDDDRQFEDDAESEDDRQKQVSVFGDRDHRLELFSLLDQKCKRFRKDKSVSKVSAGEEESDC